MEGDGATEPKRHLEYRFAAPLVRVSVWVTYDWWRPKPRPGQNAKRVINNLATHRWYGSPLSADKEIDAVCRVQVRDKLTFDKLLAGGTYWNVLKVARSPLRHPTDSLLYEDLVAAGVAAMWKAALKFDRESGYRLWTGVRKAVLGAISDEARRWRRQGSRETRLDRWLYTHPHASPEQVLRAQQRLVKRPVFRSLQEAAEGIKQFWAWESADFDYSTTEADEPIEIAGGGSFVGMYSCFDRFSLSPQLEVHEELTLLVDRLAGAVFDAGPDVGNASRPKAPREPLDCTETAFIQFKNGKRQVTRQKAASYCYGIVATPELRARALEDLKFAEDRWQSRIRRGPLPTEQYPRWSTKWLNHGFVGQGTLGRAEDGNKHLVPAYLQDGNPFKWKVEFRGGSEGIVLSVLESPSWHCLKPRPCEFCEAVRNRLRANNVPRLSVSLSAA